MSGPGRAPRAVMVGPYPPPHGGVEVHLATLRDYLNSAGWDCAAVNISRHRGKDGDGVYYPASGLDVLRTLRRLDPDVVHLHVGGEPSLREIGLCLALRWLVPGRCVATFHAGSLPSVVEDGSAAWRRMFGSAVSALDRVIAVNTAIAATLESVGGNGRTRLVAPHAYGHIAGALNRVPDLPPAMAEFAGAHQPLLVIVGGLEPEYQVEQAVAAVARLRETRSRAGLLVIGDGTLRDKVTSAISRLGVGDHVFMAGDVSHDVTLRAIERADAMLRVTTCDGDAISVREALWLGTPVIATENRMRPDGVVTVPEAEPGLIAQAAINLLGQPLTVESDPDENANLAAVVDVYREMGVHGPRGPGEQPL